jgi:solute carrier family 25 folate transporter 32
MSHERSTPPAPAPGDYSHATPTLSGRSSGYTTSHEPLTLMERFAVERTDSTFHAIAGATGGFASGVVTCPLDVIKTKLQAQGGFRAGNGQNASAAVYQGMFGTARVIWSEEGLRGLYRGLGPIILGYLPTWAVWFTVYGKSKTYFSTKTGEDIH